MVRRHVMALRLLLASADALTAMALFVGVSVLRFDGGWIAAWDLAGIDWRIAAIGYGFGWVLLVWLHGLYRLGAHWSIREDLLSIVRAATLYAVLLFSALFVLKLPQVSRLFMVGLMVSQLGVSAVSRTALRWAIRRARIRGLSTRYVVIIGTGNQARTFAGRIERHRELGLRIIGHLSWSGEPVDGGLNVMGSVDDIESVLHQMVVDEVAICLPATGAHLIEPIAQLCENEGKIVRMPVGDVGFSLPSARIEHYDGIAIQSLVYGPDRIIGLIGKRTIDIVLAVLGLIVLSPLLLGVAVIVRLVDGTPVLFRQERVGLHGRLFRIVKFRSMVHGAEERLDDLADQNEIKGQAFKLTHDPRLSRTGRLLRASSLDELPQLWNVVRGEMSLVGPRPPLPREVEHYDLWHRRRLSMKPGITGLWQVQARDSDDFDHWVELDLAYIDGWSLWLDMKIMLRTIPALLQGR